MKVVTLVARLLLGFIFVVFGANGFLHFIPQPPLPPGLALEYFMVMVGSHYLALPFALQLISGALLLFNRFVPLALALIAPVIVNILMFHILMQPEGLPPGAVATALWFIVFANVRDAFTPLIRPRSTS